jgi:hypothetical protein
VAALHGRGARRHHVFSGVVYLLLVQSLVVAAGPALLFLLAFITGAGITLGLKDR